MRPRERSRLSKIVPVTAILAAAVVFAAPQAQAGPLDAFAMLPPGNAQLQPRPPLDDQDQPAVELPGNLQRQLVAYRGSEGAGTVIIDTPHTYLYLVLGGGKAMRYGIGVGREGFTWSGVQQVSRKSEWPDWYPPPAMIARQPYLPRFVGGGPGNPLGARAMYLGGTQYRIHGTNDPTTIGKQVSSGCIRMTNADVVDLYSRVGIGTKVVVLPMSHRADAAAGPRS
jgi:lipoprotein-anchoring transpeptidase ErfK/SrfK